MVAAGALALVARAGALFAAWCFVSGAERPSLDASAPLDPSTALAAGVALATAAVFVARRVVATVARLDVERDLTVASSRALLRSDVVEEPEAEPHFALSSGLYYATDAIANTLPSLAADVIAAGGAALLLALTLPGRLLGACAAAALVVGCGTVLLRARTARLHERATRAQEKVGEALVVAIEGRLELVAGSVDDVALARLTAAADDYRQASRREVFGTALMGRVPLGAAILVGGAFLFATSPDEPWSLGVSALVVLGAALSPLLGVAFGAQEVLRLGERLAPFAKVVLRAERPELAAARPRTAEVALAPLAFERVDFAYSEGGANVLDDLSFEWPARTVVLRGANGSGKSTALRLLVGLRAPTAGRVRLGEADLRELDVSAVRRRMAYLPQRSYLGEAYTTVREAFELLVPGATREQMTRALERTGLAAALASRGRDPLARSVGELSGGQRQRLALARVLCRDAEIVLLDEPDANLDQAGLALLVTLIDELRREGRTVAVAAHGALADLPDAVTWEIAPGARDRAAE